jgi:hypothetical protein
MSVSTLSDVDVDGRRYNVTFLGAPFAQVASDLQTFLGDPDGAESAARAVNARLNSEFVQFILPADGPSGPYAHAYSFDVPYAASLLSPQPVPPVSFPVYQVFASVGAIAFPPDVFPEWAGPFSLISRSPSPANTGSFASFALVPIPAALPLMLGGLVTLGAIGRRRSGIPGPE